MDEAPALPLVSATQIKLWKECKRKWGFKYIDRLVVPTHPGALLGTEVQDEQLDPYLASGRGFDFTRPSGEIANSLVPLLPAPGAAGLRLRRKFLMPSPSGRFGYQGEFDIYADDSAIVPGLAGGAPLLGDIKTTSNLAYALTEETLKTDIQSMLYSADIMFHEECVDVLDLVWWYARTRGSRKSMRVHVRVGAQHVADQFGQIESDASELVTIKVAKPKVEDLPPNARMCEQYGGCPYRSKCNLSPSVHAEAVNKKLIMLGQQSNNFLDSLRQGTPVAQIPAPAATVPALPSNVVHVQEVETLPLWATAPVDPRRASTPAAVNPPESALPPAPPVGVAAPVAEAATKKRGRPAKVVESEAPRVAVSSEVAEASSASFFGDDFPRSEFATFLRAWASRMEGQ